MQIMELLPFYPKNGIFSTDALNVIDEVLSKPNAPDRFRTKWTPAERAIHKLHMIDLWKQIIPIFHNIQTDTATCECLMNVDENGVNEALGKTITYLGRVWTTLYGPGNWKVWKDAMVEGNKLAVRQDAAYFLRCFAPRT